MDAERFDSLTRVLARRAPRRVALRSGVGLAATLLGVVGLRSSEAASTSAERYTAVRQYAVTGKTSDAGFALKGLLTEIEATAGFIDYSVVDVANGALLTISVFADQKSSAAAAALEYKWIAKTPLNSSQINRRTSRDRSSAIPIWSSAARAAPARRIRAVRTNSSAARPRDRRQAVGHVHHSGVDLRRTRNAHPAVNHSPSGADQNACAAYKNASPTD